MTDTNDYIDVLMDEDKKPSGWQMNEKGNYVLYFGRFLLTVFPRDNFTGGASWRWSRSSGLGRGKPVYSAGGVSTPEKAMEAAVLAAQEAMLPKPVSTGGHPLEEK